MMQKGRCNLLSPKATYQRLLSNVSTEKETVA